MSTFLIRYVFYQLLPKPGPQHLFSFSFLQTLGLFAADIIMQSEYYDFHFGLDPILLWDPACTGILIQFYIMLCLKSNTINGTTYLKLGAQACGVAVVFLAGDCFLDSTLVNWLRVDLTCLDLTPYGTLCSLLYWSQISANQDFHVQFTFHSFNLSNTTV